MPDSSLSTGDIIEVSIERLAYGGDGVARYNGLALFVPFAAPGERLRVRVTEVKKNFARAAIEQVVTASDSRREAPCRYFGECGGCQLQHINYQAQLLAKEGFVRDALERVGRVDWPHEIQIRHAGELGYRARAQVKLERVEDSRISIGFARAGSRSVCDVESCPILVPELDSVLEALRSAAKKDAAIIGGTKSSSEVNIAAGDSGFSLEPRVSGLPGGVLTRRAAGFSFRFSPATFFQANPMMLETLISEAIGNETGSLAIDLFAGVGLFTLPLARRYTRVIGIEADRRSTSFARDNIEINKLSNVDVNRADAAAWMEKRTGRRKTAPDLILLDPPRTGAADTIPHIIIAKPERITYVSCDPTTLARDLRKLLDAGYQLRKVVALDMFPQTYHVETVVALARK